MNKKIVKIATLLLVGVGLAAVFVKLDVSWIFNVDLDRIQDLAQDNLIAILLITLGLSIVQNMFTVVPLILLISLNISLFGFVNGYLWSWLCSIIGASLAFLAARFWIQDFITAKLNRKWVSKLEENGLLYTFLGRMFPFAPTSLINIAAGGSTIRYKSFLYGTIGGNMIFFFVMSLLSEGFMSADLEHVVTIACCLLVAAGAYYWHRRKKERAKQSGDS